MNYQISIWYTTSIERKCKQGLMEIIGKAHTTTLSLQSMVELDVSHSGFLSQEVSLTCYRLREEIQQPSPYGEKNERGSSENHFLTFIWYWPSVAPSFSKRTPSETKRLTDGLLTQKQHTGFDTATKIVTFAAA